jgi:ligand-binding SRPBCC domain-containing protein
MRLLLSTEISAPSPQYVLARFDERLFRALAPPFPKLRVDRFDGCSPGDLVAITMDWGFMQQPWLSRITEAGDNTIEAWFVDEGQQLPWPFRYWRHRHLMTQSAPGRVAITEDLTYRTPLRLLDWLIRPAVWALLAYRKPIYQRWQWAETVASPIQSAAE